MAVKIPSIQRLPSTPSVPGARVQFQPVDALGAISASSRSVENLIQAGGEFFAQMETVDAQNLAMSERRKLRTFDTSRTVGTPDKPNSGIRFQTGDPTERYNNHDQQLETEYKRVIEQEGLSDKTRRILTAELTSEYESIRMKNLNDEAVATQRFETENKKATVILDHSGMSEASENVLPGEASTLFGINKRINNIRKSNLTLGISRGSVVENKNGKHSYTDDEGNVLKFNMTPSAEVQLKKDISDGLFKTLDILNKSGQVEKSTYLLNNYEKLIDPVSKAKLLNSSKTAVTNNKAATLASKVINLSQTKQELVLKKEKNLEVRNAALKLLEDLSRRTQNLRDDSSKHNFNSLTDIVFNRQYISLTEAERDPEFNSHFEKITDAKQKQSIRDQIEQPTNSESASVQKMQNLLFGEDPTFEMTNISPQDFNTYLAGLNKSDRTFYSRKYESFNTQTGAERNTLFKTAGGELTRQLLGLSVITKNVFGKLTNLSEKRLILLRNEFIDELDKQGLMTNKEIKDFALEFATAKKKDTAFTPVETPRFRGGSRIKVAVPKLSIEEKQSAVQRYRDVNNDEFPTDDELRVFLENEESLEQ